MAQVAPPDRQGLRRLAEIQLDRPVVLSFYLDLDPTEFATPSARATAVRSLIDEAGRRIRDLDGLSHQDRMELEHSLERASTFLQGGGAPTEGAHALAIFASEEADLFEVVRLPRSVPLRVAIDRAPVVAPLAGLEQRERWCVALVNRRDGRVFRGAAEGLREVEWVRDEVHGQHDQGGWSQARFQRGIEKEKDDHLRHVAAVLLEHFKRQPFERLVVGGPHEVVSDFEGKLHRYLTERLGGHIDVDVETANADDVLAAARPLLEELEEGREREAIERLDGKRAAGKAATGLTDVLEALNERRVETLMLLTGLSEPGTECPTCGWLGPDGVETCPADGTPLERRDDVIEPAVELALRQSAEVLPVRRREGELRERGGIAALLRF
jgi:peptide chain release factor subunit 1